MQNEGFFFLALLVFFFVLWLAGGGPTKPFSFSGPYITPVTDVGQSQVGYGGSSWLTGVKVIGTLPTISTSEARSSLQSAQSQLGTLQLEARKQALFRTPSPHRGEVRITGGNFSATDIDQEYVSLSVSSSATAPVTITGWRLQSLSTDRSVVIGQGSVVPESGVINNVAPIVLNPGDRAYVITGESPIGASFAENMCTGYFEESQNFNPSLSMRCPSAADEFDHYYTGNQYKDSGCYDLSRKTSTCQVPDDRGRVSSYCLALIDSRLTYNGCLATHRYDTSFASGIWRIYLGRTKLTRSHDSADSYGELWKSSRDGVRLVDENGLTVDLYTY